MYDLDEVRTAEYLANETPTAVFNWLKAQPKRKPADNFFGYLSLPDFLEKRLYERGDSLIDIALASWATRPETLLAIYEKYCGKSTNETWPPIEGSHSYNYLRAILSNTNIYITPWRAKDGNFGGAIPDSDFENLVEFGEPEILRAIHLNFGMGEGLLELCAARSGAYGRMSDEQWLHCIACLGYNEALHNADTSNNDGPDLTHAQIHENFIKAATVSPKTFEAACVFGNLFKDLPVSASKDAYVKDELLAKCIVSWNTDIQEPSKGSESFNIFSPHSEKDGLQPTERVQFHIMRHYTMPWDVDPQNPQRLVRLVAYAINPVNGGESVLSKHARSDQSSSNGLDIESLTAYSERDGAAFYFATAYNKYIWTNKDNVVAYWKQSRSFRKPVDHDHIDWIREQVIDAYKAEKLADRDEDEDDEETSKNLGAVEGPIDEAFARLNQRLTSIEGRLISVKRWLAWGGSVVLLILLFKH